ncbi:MAG: penicillin-binding transpeptidase domain-containing protein [Vulcanimicrobiaceae bacterium]
MNVNGAIARLVALFAVAYALLAARQVYVQVIAGPSLARNVHNPRNAALAKYRGAIVARDGTVLARSTTHGRIYPLGASLAHALGYDSVRYGSTGLEEVYDRDLAGRPVASDVFAQFAQLSGTRAPAPALRGSTVVTTVEPAVQATLYHALAAYPRAAGVALDPRTGAVLALASVPSYDPAAIDTAFASLAHDARSPLLDRSLDGLYPPGSTFKIFTAAAALEAGAIAPDTTFNDPGTLEVGNFVVHDNEGEATGTQDLAGAFALSSNVDFAQIALKLGVGRWYDAAGRWRLGESPGFTLPVQRDRIPARAGVSPSILAQLGFGQADLLVTPLRMALVAATIGSGGTTPRPYLVSEVRGSHVRVEGAPHALASPITAEVAAHVRDIMVATVRRGTGRAAAIDGVEVAGKTGTATNPAGRSHAWFVAFAPAAAPRVAVAIVVENAGYGGDVAAPIARNVIASALAHGPR